MSSFSSSPLRFSIISKLGKTLEGRHHLPLEKSEVGRLSVLCIIRQTHRLILYIKDGGASQHPHSHLLTPPSQGVRGENKKKSKKIKESR